MGNNKIKMWSTPEIITINNEELKNTIFTNACSSNNCGGLVTRGIIFRT